MAINVNLVLTAPETAADFTEKARLALNDDPKSRLNAIANYLVAAAGGQGSVTAKVQVDAVKASGTVTLASVLANDTVTIDGVVLTAVSGTPAANQFDMSGSDTVDAVSFVAAVAANATLASKVVATSALGVVTLTALTAGTAGNSITLASSNGSRLAVSAARLASGTNGTEYTVQVGQ